jgi:sporulation-control protein
MGRVLSRFGVGAAEVDTVLERTTLRPGETVGLRVEVTGGDTTQRVEGVDFRLRTRCPTGGGHGTSELVRVRAAEPFTVEPEELRTFTATMQVPYGTPVTRGGAGVWVETGLNIDWAVDPGDRDDVTVEPGERFAAVVEALEGLGFASAGVGPAALDGVSGLSHSTDGAALAAERPCLQRFDYRPHSGPFAGRIETVELVPVPSPSALHLVVAVDRHTDVVGEQVRTDRSGEWYRVREPSASRVQKELRSRLENYG